MRRKSEITESSILMNRLLSKMDSRKLRYLEIGLEYGSTFHAVNANVKFGVDPEPRTRISKGRKDKVFIEDSDTFFSKNLGKFDLIFLDGLHTFDQTYRDLRNSFLACANNGVIVVDDTVPSDTFSAIPDALEAYRLREESGIVNTGAWHGDVFKIPLLLSQLKFKDIKYATLIDLGNPKTVIWLAKNGQWPILPNLSPEIYGQIDFENVFKNGVPVQFNPTSTDELLRLMSTLN